jgi:hypothetical protein
VAQSKSVVSSGAWWEHFPVREADRPIELRVSVVDRPRADEDVLPIPGRMFEHGLDESSIRLALVVGDWRMYIARGVNDDEIYQWLAHPSGGGGSGGSRSTFVTHGALVAWGSGGDGRCIAHGVVPDAVIAVRVDGVQAVLANNAYVAEVPGMWGEIILTTAEGEREFPRPPSLRPLRDATESTDRADGRGYLGMVEYAWSGMTDLEIDDLDRPDWRGTIQGVFLINGNGPKIWRVGVVLLEGPRAGQLGIADLVVERGDSGPADSVEFVGREPFGPHPDPPRLEAALQRLRKLGGRY